MKQTFLVIILIILELGTSNGWTANSCISYYSVPSHLRSSLMNPQYLELNEWLNALNSERLLTKLKLGFVNDSQGQFFGTITASPDADYQYMWRRDSAIVMQSLLDIYGPVKSSPYFEKWAEKTRQMQVNWNWSVDFKYKSSTDPDPAARNIIHDKRNGEPKFNKDGTSFLNGGITGWMRTQDDGPALAVIAFSNWAQALIADGKKDIVQRYYNGTLDSLIKSDLEYVSHVWKEQTGDPWEEVHGHHVYTLMVIRRALLKGAALAKQMNDPGASDFYLGQATQIQKWLQDNMRYQGANGQTAIRVTWGKDRPGMDHKISLLDVQSAILAPLHGDLSFDIELKKSGLNLSSEIENFMTVSSSDVLNTFYLFEKEQNEYFYINKATANLGLPPALGRYAFDTYMGGNPWVLSTLAAGTFHSRLYIRNEQIKEIRLDQTNIDFYRSRANGLGYLQAGRILKKGEPEFVTIQNAILSKAIGYGLRVKFHSPRLDVGDPSWGLNEQINGMNGQMMSYRDLTWNYAELIFYKQSLKQALDLN